MPLKTPKHTWRQNQSPNPLEMLSGVAQSETTL